MKLYSSRGNALIPILVWGAIIWAGVAFWGDDTGSEPSRVNSYESYDPYSEEYYEEEYPVGFEGTDTMEACNSSSGRCYNLDVDSDGENVERINFPNGGYRDVYSSDCDGGYCVVEDEDGNEWELTY